LNVKEVNFYNKFKETMIEEFDKDNAKHESNLETLKNIAFEKSQRDVDWKLIGF